MIRRMIGDALVAFLVTLLLIIGQLLGG